MADKHKLSKVQGNKVQGKVQKPLCVVVLDTMHVGCSRSGAGKPAPAYFRINPENHSGKRLYKLVDKSQWNMLVTNSCGIVMNGPADHGNPDPTFLHRSILRIISRYGRIRLLLVCGNTARDTFLQTGYYRQQEYVKDSDIIEIMYTLHPAARTWTRPMLEETREKIRRYLLP